MQGCFHNRFGVLYLQHFPPSSLRRYTHGVLPLRLRLVQVKGWAVLLQEDGIAYAQKLEFNATESLSKANSNTRQLSDHLGLFYLCMRGKEVSCSGKMVWLFHTFSLTTPNGGSRFANSRRWSGVSAAPQPGLPLFLGHPQHHSCLRWRLLALLRYRRWMSEGSHPLFTIMPLTEQSIGSRGAQRMQITPVHRPMTSMRELNALITVVRTRDA